MGFLPPALAPGMPGRRDGEPPPCRRGPAGAQSRAGHTHLSLDSGHTWLQPHVLVYAGVSHQGAKLTKQAQEQTLELRLKGCTQQRGQTVKRGAPDFTPALASSVPRVPRVSTGHRTKLGAGGPGP